MSWELMEGVLFPKVEGYRLEHGEHGVRERQQAARLCELAAKFNLTQQVNLTTRGSDILDLIGNLIQI